MLAICLGDIKLDHLFELCVHYVEVECSTHHCSCGNSGKDSGVIYRGHGLDEKGGIDIVGEMSAGADVLILFLDEVVNDGKYNFVLVASALNAEEISQKY